MGDGARIRLARLGKVVIGNGTNAGIAMPYRGVRNCERVRRLERADYVYDSFDNAAARDGGAAVHAAGPCTPDFFVFDGDRRLVYRGQMDDSRPGNPVPVTGADLRAALDAVLEGELVPEEQKPSRGCNIKWKAGNEPDYF